MSVVDVFGAGIPLSTNFALQSNLPVDARLVVANEDSLAQFNKNNLYVGAIVYVVETDQHYKFNADFTFTPFKTGGDCNMIIFASEAAKAAYLGSSLCRQGQIVAYGNDHYKIVKKTIEAGTETLTVDQLAVFEGTGVKSSATVGQEFDTEVNPAKTLINSLTLRDGQTYTLNFTAPASIDGKVYLIDGENLVQSITPFNSQASGLQIGTSADGGTEDGTVIGSLVIELDLADLSSFSDLKVEVQSSEMTTLDYAMMQTDTNYIRTEAVTAPIGGLGNSYVPSGTIQEILDAILYPPVAPEVTLTSTTFNDKDIKEKEVDAIAASTTVPFSITVTKHTNDIASVKFYVDGVETPLSGIASVTGNTQTLSGDYANASGINASIKFKVVVEDTKGMKAEKELSVTYVDPMYAFSFAGAASAITETEIKAGTKILKAKGAVTSAYTHTASKAVFAYPASYGTVTKIVDQNGFDITGSFETATVAVETNVTGPVSVNYTVVVAKTDASLSNFKISFNF